MNITLFGASGKTGQVVLKEALSRGHRLTAYVRRADSISEQDPNLKIIVGNLKDQSTIENAIQGADACISCLGGSSLRKQSVEITEGIDCILTLMEKQNVNRFVYLSSIGAGESRFFMSQPIRFIVADILLRVPLADHNLNEQGIKESKAEWTIVRPGGLTDETHTGNIKFGTEKTRLKGNPKISRANVATFILDQLSNEALSKKAFWLYE